MFALVSLQVTKEGRPVSLAYRQKPFSEQDSGWRIFSGEESGEYAANPDNIQPLAIEELVSLAPELEKFLSRAVGSVFERKRENGQMLDVSPGE